MKKRLFLFFLFGSIIFVLIVCSLLVTHRFSSARAESFPFAGYVWWTKVDSCCPYDYWLHVKAEKPGYSSGWQYQPYNCHYNSQAGDAGYYTITARFTNDEEEVTGIGIAHNVYYNGENTTVRDIKAYPSGGPDP